MNGAQGGAFAKEGLSAGNTPMVKGAVQGGPAALSIQGVDVDVRMVQEERHARERAGTRCNVQCGTPRCWYVKGTQDKDERCRWWNWLSDGANVENNAKLDGNDGLN